MPAPAAGQRSAVPGSDANPGADALPGESGRGRRVDTGRRLPRRRHATRPGPGAFAVLAGTRVTFAYSDARTELRATRPVIGVDPRGRIREIRFDGSSTQPPRLPPAEITAFYAAYRAFAELVGRPDMRLAFRLSPGDCLILDTTRILHGRTGFTDTGRRHLQLCWADLDRLASKLALMRRENGNGKAGP